MYASTSDVEQQERATAGIHDRTTCYVKLPRSLARAVNIMVKRLASARFPHRARRAELCTAGPSPHKRSLARRAGDDHCIELRLPKGFHGSGGCLRQCGGQGAAASTTRTASVRSAAGEASPTGSWMQTVLTAIEKLSFQVCVPSAQGRLADSAIRKLSGGWPTCWQGRGTVPMATRCPAGMSQLV